MIELTLPYPISSNRYWATRVVTPKGGGRPLAMTYVTPEAREYIATVARIAAGAGIIKPIAGRVSLDLKLYPHRPLDYAKRMRQLGANWDDSVRCIDLGNAEKVISDALQGVVIENDKWIWHQDKTRMEPDGEARVVVRITPLALPVSPQADLLAACAP